MRQSTALRLAFVSAVCSLLVGTCSSLEQEAPLGAYLGCFDVPHIKSLAGMRKAREAPYTPSTIPDCTAACREGNFTITAISPELHCWCTMATPSIYHKLPDSKCQPGGPGLVVLYQHDYAAHSKCRVAATPLTADDIAVDYNQHNIEYTPANITFPGQMRIRMEGSSGARVQPKAPRQMYGQFEVAAKVDSAAGAVTAFYVRDADWYDPENKGDFEEIDVEFLNANPGVPHSVWLNSYHRGLSRGERLVKPEQYQQLLGLSNDTNNSNTWLTYTFTWQASHVIWAINGVPILRRTTGELVTWNDMLGKPYARVFGPPDKKMHVSFSMWSDSSRFHFGGELDYSQSPYYSYFRELRRIVCDVPITTAMTNPYGPTWLYTAKASWPAPPNPTYTAPTPPPSASPAAPNTTSTSPAPAQAVVKTSPPPRNAASPAATGSVVVSAEATVVPTNAAPSTNAAPNTPALHINAAPNAHMLPINTAPNAPALHTNAAPNAPALPTNAAPNAQPAGAVNAPTNKATTNSAQPSAPNAAAAAAANSPPIISAAAARSQNSAAAANVAAAGNAAANAAGNAAAPTAATATPATAAAPTNTATNAPTNTANNAEAPSAEKEAAHAAPTVQAAASGHTAAASAHRRPRRWLQQLQSDLRAVASEASGTDRERRLAEALSAAW